MIIDSFTPPDSVRPFPPSLPFPLSSPVLVRNAQHRLTKNERRCIVHSNNNRLVAGFSDDFRIGVGG